MYSSNIDKFIEDFFTMTTGVGTVELVSETEDAIVLSIELPGFKKEQIELDIDGGFLKVSAARDIPSSDKVKLLSGGRPVKKFSKSYKIGASLDTDKVSAEFTDGILEITIQKKEETKKKSVKIS